MFLRLVKGTGPGVIFLIAVTLLAIWISAFLRPAPDIHFYYPQYSMPLYGLTCQVIGNSGFLATALSLSLTALLAFLLINFNTTVFFINERTFLPALMFILIVGVFPQYQLLNPAIPSSLFLMVAIRRIMDGYRKPGIAYIYFDVGILISIGSLFYANLIWFGVLIIIGIILLRTGNIGEIAISLLGLITPYLVTFGLYYVLGYDLKVLLDLIRNNLFTITEGYDFPRLTIVTLIFEGIIILVSTGYLLMLLNTKKIKSRKTFSLLIWVFILSMSVYFAVPSVSVEMIWISGIPVSYFLSHYFIFSKNKIVSEIFFSVMFVLVLLIQCLYLFL